MTTPRSLSLSPAVPLALVLRRLNCGLGLSDAIWAARYLLSIPLGEVNRYRSGGYLRRTGTIRAMAYLAKNDPSLRLATPVEVLP